MLFWRKKCVIGKNMSVSSAKACRHNGLLKIRLYLCVTFHDFGSQFDHKSTVKLTKERLIVSREFFSFCQIPIFCNYWDLET